MLSIILWTIGGFIALSVLFFLAKMVLLFIGVKKVIDLAREEASEMPNDYHAARKEVQNENAAPESAMKHFARKTLDRWYKKM
jgi:hypothetical protein